MATCEPSDKNYVCAVDYYTGDYLEMQNKCELYKYVCDEKGGKGTYYLKLS